MGEEPANIRIGETTTWTKSESLYPASAGWTLKYTFNGSGGTKTITATADGDDYDVTIYASGDNSVSTLIKGSYTLIGFVEKGTGDSTERHVISTTTIELLPNLFSGSATDQRSFNRKVLDALKAVLEKRATHFQQAMTEPLSGKSIQYLTHKEMIEALTYFENKVADEIAKENIAKGKSSGRIIKAQFTEPV